ncbi:hypothetical protein M422DRAFT_783793 [Sphaerobolus stellatus SS14]|uniref:Unplaced genomic scaffold SPHSTscaffold_168, whole genome shotgun sequence n=1 Tax=Sphaerobolus stellatus (strain SS14) TaxID=990650 RepID=A0A0C9UA57_SPHS4|nr:hypothetical protein M422DRAFT_783793 [Sphaerobolus stellatus SS14]
MERKDHIFSMLCEGSVPYPEVRLRLSVWLKQARELGQCKKRKRTLHIRPIRHLPIEQDFEYIFSSKRKNSCKHRTTKHIQRSSLHSQLGSIPSDDEEPSTPTNKNGTTTASAPPPASATSPFTPTHRPHPTTQLQPPNATAPSPALTRVSPPPNMTPPSSSKCAR